nr:hypothetical protein [Anoxynatronum buryatiense]
MKHKYPVITLCGSTRFKEDFVRVQRELTLKRNVVISVGLFGHADGEYQTVLTEEVKEMLDDMHLQKIDMAEAIYVVNPGGYIGSSTKKEIEYAKQQGKRIEYLEEQVKLG